MTTWTDMTIPANILKDPVKLSRFIRGIQQGAMGTAEMMHPYTPMHFTGRMVESVQDTYANAKIIEDKIQITRETALVTLDETNKRIYLRK